VVFGRFTAKGPALHRGVTNLEGESARLLPALRETGSVGFDDGLALPSGLANVVASDRNYALSLAEFTKHQRRLRLDAFETLHSRIVGKTKMMPVCVNCERRRGLEPELGPNLISRWAKSISRGVTAMARCPGTPACPKLMAAMWKQCLPPVFAGSSWVSGRAEEVFTSLQEALKSNMVSGADLPEILNDLAIARARQGKTAAAQN